MSSRGIPSRYGKSTYVRRTHPADALLDLPYPGEDQRQALIRGLEREHGRQVGSWSRLVSTERYGAVFQDGTTVVLEREAHPRGTWAVAKDGETDVGS
jgi:hypothetical protein